MNSAQSFTQKPKQKLFTVSQAAEYLGISTKTLRRWDKKRILVSFRTAGGQRRYHKDLLCKFKTQQQLTRTFVRGSQHLTKEPTEAMAFSQPKKKFRTVDNKGFTFESLILPIILFIFLLITTCLYFL